MVFQEWGKPEYPEKNPQGMVYCATSATSNITYTLILILRYSMKVYHPCFAFIHCPWSLVLSSQLYPWSVILCSESWDFCSGKYCPESSVHGLISSVHGPGSTLLGPRSMVYCSWSTVHSPQSTVHSPRSTVHSPVQYVIYSWTALSWSKNLN